jgi:hypothetical protein
MDELQADPGAQQFVGQVRTAALARRSDGDRLPLAGELLERDLGRVRRSGCRKGASGEKHEES